MIKLTIDNKKVKAKKGETVLEVAQREGIYIPTLCYQKDLTPYGGCRLCLVEVKGWSMPTASCTLPVEDGMVIKTNTPKLKKLRTFTLQLILSEHPHSCLICEKEEECAQYQECIQKSSITFGCKFCSQNNNCELQKLVDYLGIKEIPFIFNYRNIGVERFDPFFDRDYNICILCGRCVRVCHEVRGAGVLDFHHRGSETLVGTAFDLPHLETGCQFCGACVDVCPTGALRQRYGKWEGEVQRSVTSTCVLCSIGCSIELNVCNNKVVSSTPHNNQICVRGRFGIAPLIHHPKRVTFPMLKKDGRVVEVSWEEALNYVVSKLTEHKGKTGIMFSPQLTIEAIHSVCALADNLQCNTTSTPSELGNTIVPLDFKKITSDSIFVFMNTDMISDFSPLLLKLKIQSKQKATFVVIDAVHSRFAENADLWLRPKLGKELDLLKLLCAKNKMSNSTGISHEDITSAKDVLSGKKIYLVYNAKNINGMVIPKSVTSMPLFSRINSLNILDSGVDCSVDELLHDKNIDCLYLVGVAPKLNREYKTIIVQDYFLPSFDFDLFLPAATFAETKGTLINIEGKLKKLRKAIEPLGKSQPDNWIVAEIGRRLKFDVRKYKPKRKKACSYLRPGKINKSKDYPYYLIVRENCYSYRGCTLSTLMKGFERLRHDSHIWVNPNSAKELKIDNGTEIRIIGKNFDVEMPAMISDDVPDNSVFIYSHPSVGAMSNQPVRIELKRIEKDKQGKKE
jgi:predicted molibdopterin-dependent oxidoreductase YjgC